MNNERIITQEFIEEIRLAIKNRDILRVRELVKPLHAADGAELLESLSPAEQPALFRFLPKDFAAELFAYLSVPRQLDFMKDFTLPELSGLVDELYVDDATDLLEELPANAVQRILAGTPAEKRSILNRYLRYGDDSAGSVMSEEMVRLSPDMTVERAIKEIRGERRKLAATSTLYVTGPHRRLLGVLSIRELLQAADGELIRDVMKENIISVRTDTDQEEALILFRKYDFLALPVTDSENRLVGVITADDALDISADEATEDFEIMAAMQPSETGYFETTVAEQAKNRLPWLMLLMISGMINGLILGSFEHAFVALPILVTFIPMLTDTGGNAGSQSSTLIIRGLALGEIGVRDLPGVFWKEFRIAVVTGLGLGLVSFLRVMLFPPRDPLVGLVVALAVLFIVILSKLCGGALPILAERLGLDPALMAAPLITTIVDAGGLIIFFTLAKLVFGI